jgi:regulator of nonsense transcripts 1
VGSALRVDTRFLKQTVRLAASYELIQPTDHLAKQELKVLGEMVMQAALLRDDRPKEMENEFSSVDDQGQGEVILQNSRYKNRARPSVQVLIQLAFLFLFAQPYRTCRLP